ncbi:cell division protein FtsA [Candidatus Parcubacteria bacterium]|nr:MAG: cell division protein FtsA [Candidatus Parcubacteria bacterium]
MTSRWITGLDIGTTTIKAVVAEHSGGKLGLRAVFRQPALGLRKGAVVDLAECLQALGPVLHEIKKISKSAVKNIYLSIGTPQAKIQHSKGIVAVSRADTEIYQDDVERVIKASQAVNVPPNRTIVHNVTREFIVDGVGDVLDPLGLSGSRLEVNSLIIDVFTPHAKSLMRVVELAGGEIGGLVFGPLVGSRAALSKNQKDLGVALVDIGGGTTGLSVYEENKLVGVAKFPIGGGHISNDLAIGLKIPVGAAESLKVHYGYALAKEVPSKEAVELKKFSPDAKGAVSRRFIAEIIESRLAEIFELVNNELKLMGKAAQLPGGVVLVGGGSKLPGLTELVKQELKLSSQIGFSIQNELSAEGGSFSEFLEDPEFVNAFGLALWGGDEEGWTKQTMKDGFGIRNLIRYFLP